MRRPIGNGVAPRTHTDQSVDDFCAYMQNLAREVNADDHMLCCAVLYSLKSDIKNHVTRSQPTTWKDLVDAAKVEEMCVPETATKVLRYEPRVKHSLS